MATLNSSNVTNGNTVQANDLLQLYDAFKSGGGTTGVYSVSISGSITGSASTAISASFATTASYALNGGSGGSGFPFSGSAVITGSLTVSGSGLTVRGTTTLSGSAGNTNLVADKNSILNWSAAGDTGFSGQFVLPLKRPDNPIAGAIYVDVQSDPRTLYIYDGSTWRSVELS
jgi:hypothetical protein